MGFSNKERSIFTSLILICMVEFTFCLRRTNDRKPAHLSPPVDIQLETVNCTAISVQWRLPRQNISTVIGYKVFYTPMRNSRPAGAAVVLDLPLDRGALNTGGFKEQNQFGVEIGNLRVASWYRVRVGAYGWEGEGRPSAARHISTASQELCLPPSPPSQPRAVALSDTELALSWKQVGSEGSSPVLYFLVAFIRPDLDTEWTRIMESVEASSMVLKDLSPDTLYQFVVRAVNVHGMSPPSSISSPVWTFSTEDMGSGTDGRPYSSRISDGDDFEVDSSDYDFYIKEPSIKPGKSQLRSRTGAPSYQTGRSNVIFRMNSPAPSTTTAWPVSMETTVITTTTAALLSGTFTAPPPKTATVPPLSPSLSTAPPPLLSPSLSTAPPPPLAHAPSIATPLPFAPVPSKAMPLPLAPVPSKAMPSFLRPVSFNPATEWKAPLTRLYDLPCESTACPSESFCIDDYESGGSRCHCNLGRKGDTCSAVVAIQFPKFYGSSHMAMEPLKDSYQTFQITLEFKAVALDGLLLYCGENELGNGDFVSLALLRGQLHYRFNCGSGTAQIVSETLVQLGQWHSVTVSRDGANGWLMLDDDAPVTGLSQGQYTKITFRTPLFVGGAPSVYWLVKVTGTNRGLQGCLRKLTLNSRAIDLRPWPTGQALSGADVGECSESICQQVTCGSGGVCFANRADGYICLCPLGFRGSLCQESFSVILPQFSERLLSYISAPWPQSSQNYLSFMDFEITFQPGTPDGTLLYSEDKNGQDFLSITLVGGYLEFRFDCGSGPAVVRSEEPVSLNVWHQLWVSRTARRGILQVDEQRPMEVLAEGAFTQIRCSTPLYIGGVPDYAHTKSGAAVFRPFTGCIQEVLLNDLAIPLTTDHAVGVNVENAEHPCVDLPCANGGTCRPKRDGYKCDCPRGYEGKRCQIECGTYCRNTVTEAIEIPQFIGRSYLTYDNRDILKGIAGSRTNLYMRFRSTAKDGLLLWKGGSANAPGPSSDFLSLGLHDGAVTFSYNLGSGVAVVTVNGTYSDGQWHRVEAIRDGQSGKLTVDDYGVSTGKSAGNMRQLNANGVLYVGGMKEIALHTNRQFMHGLVGCISHLTLSTNFHISLVEDATDGKNINTCGT